MPQKNEPPKIIKLEKALKLAEQWVSNMSKPADDEPSEVEERPHRLGLGAKVSRQTKLGPSNDPVERKLHAKLGAGKRKASQIIEEALASGSDALDEAVGEDLESRSNAFAKKRTAPPTSILHSKR